MIQSNIIIAALGLITTVLGSWVSYIFTRRKYNSEVDSLSISNMRKSLDFYIKLSDDNKDRLDEVLAKNENLESEINMLRSQVYELANTMCLNRSCSSRETKSNIKY